MDGNSTAAGAAGGGRIRPNGFKCYNSECKYYWGEICRASADVTLTCVGRIVHKQTNADHIRSMSDEELAKWVTEFIKLCLEANGMDDSYELSETFEADMLVKLKQPYKEDTND